MSDLIKEIAAYIGRSRASVVHNYMPLGMPVNDKKDALNWFLAWQSGIRDRLIKAQAHRRLPLEEKKRRACERGRIRNQHPHVKEANRLRARRDNKKRTAYQLSRLKTDPEFRLRWYLRKRVRQGILSQGGWKVEGTMALLGCSIEEARRHIEKQFKRGMNWDNHGKVWHIDHIQPLARFDLTKPEHRKMAFHFTNLQPLPKALNISLNDKIKVPQLHLPL